MNAQGREPSRAPVEAPESEVPLLAPADAFDPVLEVYKKDVDRTLLRENLKLTPEERAVKLVTLLRFAEELREAGRRARASDPSWGLK